MNKSAPMTTKSPGDQFQPTPWSRIVRTNGTRSMTATTIMMRMMF